MMQCGLTSDINQLEQKIQTFKVERSSSFRQTNLPVFFSRALKNQSQTHISVEEMDRKIGRMVYQKMMEMCSKLDSHLESFRLRELESHQAAELHGIVQTTKDIWDILLFNVGTCLVVLDEKILQRGHFTNLTKLIHDALLKMYQAPRDSHDFPLDHFITIYEDTTTKNANAKKNERAANACGAIFHYNKRSSMEFFAILKKWNSYDFKIQLHELNEEHIDLEMISEFPHERYLAKSIYVNGIRIEDIKRTFFGEEGCLFYEVKVNKEHIIATGKEKTHYYKVLFTHIYCALKEKDTVAEDIINKEYDKFNKDKHFFCQDILKLCSTNSLSRCVLYFEEVFPKIKQIFKLQQVGNTISCHMEIKDKNSYRVIFTREYNVLAEGKIIANLIPKWIVALDSTKKCDEGAVLCMVVHPFATFNVYADKKNKKLLIDNLGIEQSKFYRERKRNEIKNELQKIED